MASEDAALAAGGGLIALAIRRRVTVAMLTLTMVLFGLISLNSLNVELLPDLSYPTLTVRTEYEGAAPAEIETLISQPAEEALGVISGLRKLRSVSRAGQSDVVLEFAWGTHMQQAALEVREKLETLERPLDARAPVLLRFDPSTQPILRLALTSTHVADTEDEATRRLVELRRYADEDLKRKLEPVNGVAAVKVGGGLEDEIEVEIDPRLLARRGLSLDTVIQRLEQENINLSGGRVEQGGQRYLVRTVNQFASIDDIRQLRLTTSGGAAAADNSAGDNRQLMTAILGSRDPNVIAALNSPSSGGGAAQVYLGDIASVRHGYKERESIIRSAGREAVELAIYKEGGANTVATADALAARLSEIRAQLPGDISLTQVEDQAVFIRHAVDDVKTDAVIGGLLAILVIFLFLRDGWSTFVISLSLPVSIIATFFFMDRLGLSLNVMSLGGLALATGLVVDDSIVVLESIAKARERGLGMIAAALAGTREVSMAVVASTLTTVAVFLPLVFVEGIAGQLFGAQALTVAIAIMVSLVIAMTLVPMLSAFRARTVLDFPAEPESPRWQPVSRWQQPLAFGGRGMAALVGYSFFAVVWLIVRSFRVIAAVIGPPLNALSRAAMWPYTRAEAAYLRLLPAALKRPWQVLGGAALAFVLTLAALPLLGVNLLPQLAQDRFELRIKLPPGTPLAHTDQVLRELQTIHADEPGVHLLYGVSGSGTRLDASPTESGENIGRLAVVMESGADEAALAARFRHSMRQWPAAQVDLARPELFALAPPLEIEIDGYDLDALREAGQQLAAALRQNPHYADVTSSVEQGFPEIQIVFDQDRAAALGLSTRQIADAVVNQVRGNVATRYSFRDRKIDVRVRVPEPSRASVDDLRRLIVNPSGSTPVELQTVAEIIATTGPSEIRRTGQRRVALVSANLSGIDLGAAVAEVEALVAGHPLAADLGLSIGGQGEELAASTRSLVFAFALAVFLVYLVMASQFESLLHPFVILFTIPLALVGAVLALLVTRSQVSVVVFIGLILLVGLVVKNAIILIDKVNQLRAAGMDKREALVEGARSRLRPIMMTTLCAVFGFLPLALAFGEGAEVRSPMAITVIGGLLVSTLLTLLVIPVVYDKLDLRRDGVK